MIKIVPVKTRVKTVIGNIEALVTGVCIREGHITYELSYFLNGDSKNCWVDRYEFTTDVDIKQKAGFVNYDKPPEDEGQILLLPENEP